MNEGDVNVEIETDMGIIEIAVHTKQAPASSQAFLALMDDGSLAMYGGFDRAVRDDNALRHPAISIIQGGLLGAPHPPAGVRHETTCETGLRHVDGAVSLVRGALDAAHHAVFYPQAAFFICIGDQFALDCGGARDAHGDGQGFAAFGRVTNGMDIVRLIHQRPTTGMARNPKMSGQVLDPPIRILRAWRE